MHVSTLIPKLSASLKLRIFPLLPQPTVRVVQTASVPQTARETAAPVCVVAVLVTSASVGTSASALRTAARTVARPHKPFLRHY